MREILVGEALDDLRVRQEHERAHLVTRLRERDLVEVRERHDEAHVVLVDEGAQRRHVTLLLDAWHERVAVGVVERRRERVDVCGDGRGARAPERVEDVDSLPGTREEDRRHAISTAGTAVRRAPKQPTERQRRCADDRADGRPRTRTRAPTRARS